MPIDENKIINDIHDESGRLSDYDSFLHLSNNYKLKKQQKKFYFVIDK